MDKYEAGQLVRDTLQNSFDRNRFYYFIKNLLNRFDEEATFVYRGNYIPDAYKLYIDTLERVGKYEDPEGNKIDILIVRLNKESSLEYARTMQRNFVAWYLNGSRGGELKDAALVAFVSPNTEDWRFSLVKMEYKLAETPSGKVKAKEELTPARRLSFLVGLYENSHTAQSRLAPIIQDDINNPTLKQIEEAFNIEKVTKEFFEKYRELFLSVKEKLEEFVKKDPAIKADFEQKQVNTVDFAKKLLGQIVFLYFLQKKGWFGVERDNVWGSGYKDFLRRLYEKNIVDYNNYFNDILEPLFYEALAKERDDNFYSRFNCKIPFLNGGLFDPICNYDWIHTDICLPNDLFSNSYKTKEGDVGTGILDVFDRYNFTVKEDEPLEKEVAVDPEMLGKVFENLLEVKDRKSKGTYYTPREIVHYMCQESLINYLVTECEEKTSREDIEKLIKLGETAVEHDSRVGRNGKETLTYSYKLPESIRKNAELIDEKLSTIRVCDPAIGSGAFPVGMMNEIIKSRNALTSYINDKTGRTIYNFKRHAIQNCLYGVDIDPGAVEIAKLRLWLSLVVDEEDIKSIKPLPNLDYKIVRGNSLMSIEKGNLFTFQWFEELEKLKPLFFEETNANKKKEFKKQIDELIKQITNDNKDFDFEIYFSEVFHEKKGFDIVMANPPYLGEKGNKDIFQLIAQSPLGKRFYQRRMDLFYFFFHLALDIGKINSQIAFITTNYYVTADGAKKLRLDIKSRAVIKKMINFNELRIFEAAQGQHNLITVLCKEHNSNLIAETCLTNRQGFARPEMLLNILGWKDPETEYFKIPQECLYDGENYYIRAFGNKDFEGRSTDSVLDKIKTVGLSLRTFCRVESGVQTSFDKVSQKHISKYSHMGLVKGAGVFIVSKKEKELIQSSSNTHIFHRWYKNSDIAKYFTLKDKNNQEYVIYLKDEGTAINLDDKLSKHFEKFKEILIDIKKNCFKNEWLRHIVEPWIKRGNYFVLFYPRDIEIFLDEKIVAPYRSTNNIFGYNKEEWFASIDVTFITKKINNNLNLKYVLSILNSNLIKYWLWFRGKRKGNVLELYPKPLSEIPIKKISEVEQKPFVDIVDKILDITKSPDCLVNSEKQAKVKEYEKQIDQMVYKLYDLTPEEIEIVEASI